jgi:uncharacterized protein DUF4394
MPRETHRSPFLLSFIAPFIVAGCGESGGDPDPSESAAASADTFAVTSQNRLISFDRRSGAIQSSIELTGLMPDDEAIGADFRPSDGSLYVLTRAGKVYAMNPDRGALVAMSSLMPDPGDSSAPFAGLEGEAFGVNFNPVADRLRIVSDSGQNLRVNVDTGATTSDASLNPGAPSISAASYSNSFSQACRTQLYVIDASTNTLFMQDPPNAGTLLEIGDIPVARATRNPAFEIVMDSEGRGSALAFWPSASGTDIYDLDVRSGGASNARRLGLRQGEWLVGASARPPAESPRQARGEMLGVSVGNQLVSFNTGAPGQLCTQDPIQGIEAGEDVLGIDVRPANGALYALGSSGNLYTLDVETAEATFRARLQADPNDVSQPFAGLAEVDYGLGFNPVPDRLRAVSRDGVSLRINVDTGATTTDTPLSPSGMAVPAVAYTNTYAGATSTALYAIDTASGALALVGSNPASGGACPDDDGNPNCGNVSEVGPLGLNDMTDVGGFDIDANPASTTGWLTLSVGASLQSSLYVVDLATGAVSLPPGVANPTIGGNEALRAITLAANPVVRATP